jgi:hypothetical protein
VAPASTNSDTASDIASDTADLDRLLAVGPFPAALRAAIQASGLGLDRIQYRLRASGRPISLATLSCWQSGKHQPERAASMEALACLEEILGVAPKALAALVGPPRQRGRRIAGRLLELADVYRDREPILEALSRFDTDWSESLLRVSQHDRIRIGRDRRVHGLVTRAVMRATTDGPDRALAVYSTDAANAIAIRPLRGCSLGKVFADRAAGLGLAELLFGHALRRGDHVMMEYAVGFSAPFPADASWEHRVSKPIREYAVEIEFTRSQLPARCVQFTSPTGSTVETERVIALDEYSRASAVALDLGPCRFGIRWEWPARSTGDQSAR